MTVESGFSTMRSSETLHQSLFSNETHDAIRSIKDYFDRNTFESFNHPQELLELVRNTRKQYGEMMKEKENASTKAYADRSTETGSQCL